MYSRFHDEICLKQPELHAQFQLYNDFYDTCTKFHNKKNNNDKSSYYKNDNDGNDNDKR